MKRLLLFAALLAWSGMAAAVVYKWLDAQGKVQYGDRPPDGVHAEVVEVSAPAHPAPRAGAAVRRRPGGAAYNSEPKPKSTQSRRSRREESLGRGCCANPRQAVCRSRERYRKLIEGRRLYKTGDNGERQYLSSEEIDSERLNAKRDIDSICNSPT